jgi:hypothetical protein
MPDIAKLTKQSQSSEAPAKGPAVADLIEITNDPEMRQDVFSAVLDLCKDGAIHRNDLEPHVDALLSIWRGLFDALKPMQQSADKLEWRIDDEYAPIRWQAEWLLDLMGHLPGAAVVSYVREALLLTDPKLKHFAAASLLGRSELVASSEIELIAASTEVRIVLWDRLRMLGMESLMPPRWATPEQLAASELSRWVNSPFERGVPPEDVELMAKYPVEKHGETHEAYLFRFRDFPKPWEEGHGWMAGVAGPYRDGQVIGSCWSAFDAWDSMSPQEHVEKLDRSFH